jgi:hypothetical protein
MVTIKKGLSASIEREFPTDYTIGDLLADRNVLGALDAGQNVRAVSGGETLDAEDYVSDYSVITLEEAAAEKA